jgi:type IV pilus assembly protein PilC
MHDVVHLPKSPAATPGFLYTATALFSDAEMFCHLYLRAMARFTYTAEKNDGEVYKGVAQARDRFELYSIVRNEGGRILAMQEEAANRWFAFSYWNAKLSTVKEYDKVLLARNLGAMLGAGLALARALAVLERQTSNRKLASIVGQVGSDVRRGDALHDALGKYPSIFSKLFVAMVRSGEESGDLSPTLGMISDQMERMYVLKKKIRGAMIYPAIILVAIVAIGVFMMMNVVPTLADTFRQMNVQLPASTQFIIGMSDFLIKNTLLAAAGAVGVVAVIVAGAKTTAGRRVADAVFLQLPVIGEIIKEVNAARTARTLSSLLSAGVDVIGALEISREVVQNSRFRAVITEAQAAVQRGEPLSSAFVRHEHLYPPFVGEMMAVGEETGQLAEMLKRLALFYEDEVDRATKDMSTIIEPLLMLVIGAAVGFFAISMISPIYSLANNIN